MSDGPDDAPFDTTADSPDVPVEPAEDDAPARFDGIVGNRAFLVC
jgi:hypothetical protein